MRIRDGVGEILRGSTSFLGILGLRDSVETDPVPGHTEALSVQVFLYFRLLDGHTLSSGSPLSDWTGQ